jgi:hypothetical protein
VAGLKKIERLRKNNGSIIHAKKTIDEVDNVFKTEGSDPKNFVTMSLYHRPYKNRSVDYNSLDNFTK